MCNLGIFIEMVYELLELKEESGVVVNDPSPTEKGGGVEEGGDTS